MEKVDQFTKHTPTLWTLSGDWEKTAFRRRMTLMKCEDGSVVVHSAMALPEGHLKELKDFGRIAAIVIPNYFHDSEAPWFSERFPEAQIYAPSSLLEKTQSRCPKAKVLSLEQDWNQSPWAQEILCLPIHGLRLVAESFLLHKHSRTLVICDMAFNMNPLAFGPIERILMGWNRVGRGFGPSRLATTYFMKDKKAAWASLQQISKLDFDRIVVNHGDIVETNGHEIYRQAYPN